MNAKVEKNLTPENVIGTPIRMGTEEVGKVIDYDPETGMAIMKMKLEAMQPIWNAVQSPISISSKQAKNEE